MKNSFVNVFLFILQCLLHLYAVVIVLERNAKVSVTLVGWSAAY